MYERRKIALCLAFLSVFIFAMSNSEAQVRETPVKDGYALLDSLITVFDVISSDRDYYQKVNNVVSGLMVEARRAQENNLIDKIFFTRYHRLLSIIKLTLDPDPEKILTPVIDEVLDDFVHEVLAENWKTVPDRKIGVLAEAVLNEIVNLQLYLDNLEKRQKLLKEWDRKLRKS